MTDRDPLLDELRPLWELTDPMPPELPDAVLARVWAESLDDEYELLVLLDQATTLAGARSTALDPALLLQFGFQDRKVLLRILHRPDDTVRVDGWLTPARPARVTLEGAASFVGDETGPGRVEWDAVPVGRYRLRLEASDGSRTLLTDPFDL